jgi:hypothetical protein
MYSANVYKIFLASPSDVAKERQIARETINKWNELHSEETGIILQAIGWETHSYASMGDRAQGLLNKQILQDADFLIGMFWTRIGTPTGDHESGTLEEIKEHINAGKPAMLCFSDQPVQMGSVEQEQYNKLMDFKEECFGKGLVSGYESLEAFRAILNDSLVRRVNSKEPFIGFENSDVTKTLNIETMSEVNNIQISLSDAAKELLIEASDDPNGHILNLETLAGKSVKANSRNFLEATSARENARWEAALNQLNAEGFIDSLGGKNEIFRVTHSGYELADQLKNA